MTIPQITNYTPNNTGSGTNAPNAASTIINPLVVGMNLVLQALVMVPLSGDTTGATDGTVINNMLATLCADTSGNTRGLAFIGQYYVTPSNAPTCSTSSTPSAEGYYKFYGFGNATINMVGSNSPIWQWQAPNTTTPHDFAMRDITLTYLTAQSSSDTLSIGMAWSSVAGTDSGGQMFMTRLDNVNINNGWRGFGINQTSGEFTAWGLHIQNCDVGSFTGAAIFFVSPTSDGAPNIRIEHCYWTPSAGFSDTGAHSALCRIDACDTLNISNVEVNGQPNSASPNGYQHFYITASWFHIDTCKAETTPMPSGGPTAFNTFENCVGTVEGYSVQNISMGQNMYLFFCDVGNPLNEKVTFRNITMSASGSTSGTNTLTMFGGSAYPMILDGQPNFYSLGNGPVVMRLTNSGSSTTNNYVQVLSAPGGVMSDDIGDASLTLVPLALGPTATSATPSTCFWNTPLTANRTVTLSAAGGSVVADNLWSGAQYTFIRKPSATGSSTLVVTAALPTSYTIPVGGFATYQYRRSAGGLVMTASGSVN